MRIALTCLLLVALLFAGCAHEDRTGPDDHRLGGTLTGDFDDEDQADLEQRASQRGAQVMYMESFPLQFDIQPLAESECDNLRLELQQVDYVQNVGECRPLP